MSPTAAVISGRGGNSGGTEPLLYFAPAPPPTVPPPGTSRVHGLLLRRRCSRPRGIWPLPQSEAFRRGEPALVIAMAQGFQESSSEFDEHHEPLPGHRVRRSGLLSGRARITWFSRDTEGKGKGEGGTIMYQRDIAEGFRDCRERGLIGRRRMPQRNRFSRQHRLHRLLIPHWEDPHVQNEWDDNTHIRAT